MAPKSQWAKTEHSPSPEYNYRRRTFQFLCLSRQRPTAHTHPRSPFVPCYYCYDYLHKPQGMLGFQHSGLSPLESSQGEITLEVGSMPLIRRPARFTLHFLPGSASGRQKAAGETQDFRRSPVRDGKAREVPEVHQMRAPIGRQTENCPQILKPRTEACLRQWGLSHDLFSVRTNTTNQTNETGCSSKRHDGLNLRSCHGGRSSG